MRRLSFTAVFVPLFFTDSAFSYPTVGKHPGDIVGRNIEFRESWNDLSPLQHPSSPPIEQRQALDEHQRRDSSPERRDIEERSHEDQQLQKRWSLGDYFAKHLDPNSLGGIADPNNVKRDIVPTALRRSALLNMLRPIRQSSKKRAVSCAEDVMAETEAVADHPCPGPHCEVCADGGCESARPEQSILAGERSDVEELKERMVDGSSAIPGTA